MDGVLGAEHRPFYCGVLEHLPCTIMTARVLAYRRHMDNCPVVSLESELSRLGFDLQLRTVQSQVPTYRQSNATSD